MQRPEAPAEAAPPHRRRRPPIAGLAGTVGRGLRINRLSALYLWAAFMILFTFAEPGVFLTTATTTTVLTQGVVVGTLSLGLLIPLAANNFDLSIGGLMALSTVTVTWLGLHTGLPIWLNVIVALLACVLVGLLNGLIVVRLHINSFIATLGMSQLLLAAATYMSGNDQLVGNFPATFSNLGHDKVLGIPYLVLFMLVLAGILWFVLEQMPVGRYLFAVGGNAEAARLAGLRTDWIIVGSFVGSSFFAACGGIFYAMNVGLFDPTVGPGYLFPAFAAVFFGASQFSRRPNVWGTLVAYYALGFGVYGLEIVGGADTGWSAPLFQGAALIFAVALASRQGTVWMKRARGAPVPEGSGPDDGPSAPAGPGRSPARSATTSR